MADYIRLKANTYYFDWHVPKDALEAFDGKKQLRKSLKTGDKRLARQRALVELGHCLSILEDYRARNNDPRASYRYHLNRIKEEKTDSEAIFAAHLALSDSTPTTSEHLGYKESVNEAATGKPSDFSQLVISEAFEHYKEQKKAVKPKTISSVRRSVELLIDYFGKDISISQIRRSDVKKFIIHRYTFDKPKTVADRVMYFSGIFQNAQDFGFIDEQLANPFANHKYDKNDTQQYQPFSDKQLRAIFNKTKEYKGTTDSHKFPLPLLAYATGCRREELTSLKCKQIQTEDGITFIKLEAGKTINAVRRIPVAKIIVDDLLKQIEHKQEDELLFPALKSNRDDGNTGDKWGKQFAYICRKVLKIEGRGLGFHSFRVHAATNLEDAGVPESTAVWIMGHTRNLTLSYGLYSKGPSIEYLSDIIEKSSTKKLRYLMA